MTRLKGKTPLILFLILFAFWIIVAETVEIQHLLVGIVVAYLVEIFNRDFLKDFHFYGKKNFIIQIITLIHITIILIKDMIIANIQVAKIVLSPKMPISPGIVTFKTKLKSPLARTLLANSITLTPGTLTIDVDEDIFVVHYLTEQNAVDVQNWAVKSKMLYLDGEKDG
ncbi:Na+/H+ antiporter subunit E [Anaerobranca gottschalkii]|uniref:Multisubunit sodium/proton antiporter, MrpE subunit n=1 Tax=Anaerobranca gottschalkii DSM 13577 TaxID=1120990 RepID=A0A1H9YA29_9FIRM|nr:Na+/H+ antiporter subunit E [Anaerobranca gottschalkii]SES65698.1 multisubunit sodium/proton antiporter, MrpE subunit [Anaerobranca gottschalkii DSM 13577]